MRETACSGCPSSSATSAAAESTWCWGRGGAVSGRVGAAAVVRWRGWFKHGRGAVSLARRGEARRGEARAAAATAATAAAAAAQRRPSGSHSGSHSDHSGGVAAATTTQRRQQTRRQSGHRHARLRTHESGNPQSLNSEVRKVPQRPSADQVLGVVRVGVARDSRIARNGVVEQVRVQHGRREQRLRHAPRGPCGVRFERGRRVPLPRVPEEQRCHPDDNDVRADGGVVHSDGVDRRPISGNHRASELLGVGKAVGSVSRAGCSNCGRGTGTLMSCVLQ